MSTRPGVTRRPSASSSWTAGPSTRPTAVITPSVTATSAVRASAPVPSTTVPPRMIRSWSVIGPPQDRSDEDAVLGGRHADHGHGPAETEEHPAVDDEVGDLSVSEGGPHPVPEVVAHRLVVDGEVLRELRRQ